MLGGRLRVLRGVHGVAIGAVVALAFALFFLFAVPKVRRLEV